MHIILNALNRLSFIIAPIFYKLLFMSLTALLICTIILLIRRFADKKIPPAWKYIMWAMVLVALVLPYRPQSNFALTKNISQVQDISFRSEYDDVSYQEFVYHQQENVDAQELQILQKRTASLYFKSFVFDVILPLTWLFGMIFTFGFLIANKFYLSYKIKRHTVKCDTYDALLSQCKQKLNIKSNIKITVQDYISSPALTGLFKTQILLPSHLQDISDENISYILLHELAHYKRKDMLINYILLTLQAVYWFNPLVWILFGFIREDIELLNDSYVLKHIDADKNKSYAYALVEVLKYSHKIPLMPKLLCMVDGKKNVERRISMIKLSQTFKKHKIISSFACVAIIAVVSGLFLTIAPKAPSVAPINMYVHTDKLSKELVSLSFSLNTKNVSTMADAVVYSDADYADANTLTLEQSATPTNIFISSSKASSSAASVPATVQSIKIVSTGSPEEAFITNYTTTNAGDIMLTLPAEAGTYFYEIALKFENGLANYGLKVNLNTPPLFENTFGYYTLSTVPSGDVQLSISDTPDFPQFGAENEGFAYYEKATNQLHLGVITGIGHPKPGEVEGPIGSLAGASVKYDYDINNKKAINIEFTPGASPEKLTLDISQEELAEIAQNLYKYIQTNINSQDKITSHKKFITFPAYKEDNSKSLPYIDEINNTPKFRVAGNFPKSWVLSANKGEGAVPPGSFYTPVYIYDGDKFIGYIGFNKFKPSSNENDTKNYYKTVYSDLQANALFGWEPYTAVSSTNTGETGIADIWYLSPDKAENAQASSANAPKLNAKGILSYNKSLNVFVSFGFLPGTITDEEIESIAKSLIVSSFE